MIRLRADELAAKLDHESQSHMRSASMAAARRGHDSAIDEAARGSALSQAADLIRDNLTETPDERRARFEAWVRSRHPTTADVLLEMRDGEYWHVITHAEYMGWTMAGSFIQHSEEKV